MKQYNNKAFSIVIALGLTLIMMLLVLYILDYMIPYSKNVKGIQNSSNAFYQAENSVEEGLFFFNKTRTDISSEKGVAFSTSPVSYEYSTFSSGTIIPPTGEGNSEFNSNYNTLSIGNPLQLAVGDATVSNWSNVEFRFQNPQIEGQSYTLSGGTNAVINWQLSGESDTLNATGSWILAGDIDASGFQETAFDGIATNIEGVKFDQGEKLDNNIEAFGVFYTNNCGAGKKCTLKMSVINTLVSDSGVPLPYLEYKINFGVNIPLRYSRIRSKGKSYGFQKSLEVKVPQLTTNEAFDFTVFQ